MVMKNASNAHFGQIDNRIQNIFFVKGIEILPSQEAWQKYPWTRKYFFHKPQGGYFIWVKESIPTPLYTCISLSKKYSIQHLSNLLIVNKNIKVKANAICNALKPYLCGKHFAEGKIVLLSGAQLEYLHLHQWGKNDFVETNYQFILEENTRLFYRYQNNSAPKNLAIKTKFYLQKKAVVQSDVIIQGENSNVNIEENLYLQKEKSQGVINLKVVGRKFSKINGYNFIQADAPSKGHLDCQGLVVDKNTQISLIPKLVIKNKEALLTHEASLGRIKEEQLIYLRSRGLSKKEALDLIIKGFLEK